MQVRNRKIFSLLSSIISFMMMLCLFGACQGNDRRQVMVMWNTDETDPTFKIWNKKLAGEFRRQGIDAEIHPYYGEIGLSREGLEEQKIIRMIHELDSRGKRPDLILAHGDYCLWQLELNPDSLVASIPAVGFGLKSNDWMQRQKDVLTSRGINRHDIVQIHDSLHLKENLDLADLIFNLKKEGDTSVVRLHRFVSMLDQQAVWVDSLIGSSLCSQAELLDSAEYVNEINRTYEYGYDDSLNNAGIKRYYLFSIKNPLSNPRVRGTTSAWAFYSQKSRLRYIQVKHDEATRSCTEGPNFPPYCTMTAEDFIVNDSCYGGYFVTSETLFRDAVASGKRLLNGDSADGIGKSYHTPTYNVNWDLMRMRGLKIHQMPEYVRLYNTTLRDRHPVLAVCLYAAGVLLVLALLVFSAVCTIIGVRRHQRVSRLMKEKAKMSIHDEELLELALKTSDAIMWDGSEESGFRSRIAVDEEHREMFDSFFKDLKPGMSSIQFHGSIDGQPAHWYDLRVESRTADEGESSLRGFLINIDYMKMIQEKAREAHQLLLEAKAQEGFISSMNHEIRTPLHSVVGFAMELARPEVRYGKDEIAEFAGYIQSNAAALKKIINDILLVTLMSHANVSASLRSCSVESLLNPKQWREAMALAARRKNIIDIKSGGSQVMVSVDPHMMEAVMENLLSNASLFSDEGSRISVGWDETSDGGAEIWVRDCGIGIEEKYRDVIFERFYKINTFHPGGGLGLFITKTYVEKMNGTIEVESNESSGSTFIVRLKGAEK